MSSRQWMQYDSAIADQICEIISCSNKSLATIIKENNYPSYGTIYKWMNNEKDFADNYARAKDMQADFLAEEIIAIADDNSQDTLAGDKLGNPIENREFLNRSRLKVDARKWIASKLKPKKYADRIETNFSGEIQTTGQLSAEQFAQLLNSTKKSE